MQGKVRMDGFQVWREGKRLAGRARVEPRSTAYSASRCPCPCPCPCSCSCSCSTSDIVAVASVGRQQRQLFRPTVVTDTFRKPGARKDAKTQRKAISRWIEPRAAIWPVRRPTGSAIDNRKKHHFGATCCLSHFRTRTRQFNLDGAWIRNHCDRIARWPLYRKELEFKERCFSLVGGMESDVLFPA